MEAYLDNSATTRCYEEVAHIVMKTMLEDYGNPSSMHLKGVEAENYMKKTGEIIARNMKVNVKEIIFTSGGTEANNLALIGGTMANKRSGNRIITTAVEHAAVGVTARHLKELGFDLVVLPVDSQGLVSIPDLEEALTPDTILVSVMYVNNEVGTVQPIELIGRVIKDRAPKALYHVDGVQAFGKYRIFPKKLGVDILSVSGHKLHGPKGVGFLYINEKAKIQPQILGGGQQQGMRSGTDNVSGVAGLGVAVEKVYQDFDSKITHMYSLKRQLIQGLLEMEDVLVNGMPPEQGAPHIVSASFLGVRSEVLLHTLEERGIYISAGSACSSHKRTGSATLTAMGMKKSQMESTVRFSFSEETTEKEIDYCLQAIREVLPMLRKYTPH